MMRLFHFDELSESVGVFFYISEMSVFDCIKAKLMI